MGAGIIDRWVDATDQWAEADDRARIAIPVAADRTPHVTTRVAVTIARQSGLGIEFVAAAPPALRPDRERVVRARCADAIAGGASRVSWQVLDGGAADVGPYITWSGATLRCVGTAARRHASSKAAAGRCAVPLIVVGPCWRPSPGGYRHVVAGLASASGQCGPIVAAATALADRLGAELSLIEVIAPDQRLGDVPASAHLYWIASGLERPPRMFDTVPAPRPVPGLTRFLDGSTVVVVGAPGHHRWILGGVAGRLARRAPCPVLVVPVTSPGTCRTGADRRSRSLDGTRPRAAPRSRG